MPHAPTRGGSQVPNVVYALIATLCLLVSAEALAYPAPPPDPTVPESTVSPTVQQLRRAMNDPEVNSLTFHTMDQLFTTRTVPRSGPVWQLPRRSRELDFTYRFDGKDYTPAAVPRAHLHQRAAGHEGRPDRLRDLSQQHRRAARASWAGR